MTTARSRLGREGEELVARRLAAAGWGIEARNWRCAEGEVDIVARDGPCLVIVEVRTRSGERMGGPEESIGPRKRARLAALANRYVYEADWSGPCRVDVVTVVLSPDGAAPRVRHYRNAVSGEWA